VSESEDSLYDTKYYTRDVTRAPQLKFSFTPGETPNALLEAGEFPKPEKLEGSSPGRVIPVVASYDPTGLRVAITATQAALDASIEKHRPTHLPRYEWEDYADEIVADYTSKGLPPVMGRAPKWLNYAENAHSRSW